MLNPKQLKGKWARGIQPRNFTWIIQDQLALCERPGGYSRNHRPVRRQEEIIWLREAGFARVVSMLGSPHNLHAYEEMNMPFSHYPFEQGDDVTLQLIPMCHDVAKWLNTGERIMIHQEDVSDLFMGIVAGYLIVNELVPQVPNAIMVVERLLGRQMGPEGREVVVAVGAAVNTSV